MLTAWRLVKGKHLRHAFDGEGARLWGGRWNSPGTRVVYLSETLSLAALEILVHLHASAVLAAYAAIRVRFDEDLVKHLDRAALPPNWRAYPPPPDLQAIGDRWIAAGTSAVLRVPSVVVHLEHNYLVNPAHKDFALLARDPPAPFTLDRRLLKH